MIHRIAGATGLDPRPFSFRALLQTWEGRDRAEWDRAAAVVAAISNSRRAKGRPLSAADVNPYLSRGGRGGITIKAANIGILKTIFVKGSDGGAGD